MFWTINLTYCTFKYWPYCEKLGLSNGIIIHPNFIQISEQIIDKSESSFLTLENNSTIPILYGKGKGLHNFNLFIALCVEKRNLPVGSRAATNSYFHNWLISNRLVYKMSKSCERCSSHLQWTAQNQKDSSFTSIDDKEIQQILIFTQLEPTNLWHVSDWNDQATTETVGDYYFFDRLIA